VIRNDKSIRSWLDAQGFRKNGIKLNVAPVEASIFHYGWVKPPKAQQAKQQSFHRYWHSDRWIEKSIPKTELFDYHERDFFSRFKGTHPAVMHPRIQNQDWEFSPETLGNKHSLKSILLRFIEKRTGWRIGEYRNYHLVRKKVLSVKF
jgi:hypothetical protein